MKHSINEWQDFSLRKDVEKISRELHKTKKYEKPLIIELLITAITLLLDKFLDLFDQCIIVKKVVFSALAFFAFITLIYLLYILIKEYLNVKTIIKKSAVTIKPYVDSFDNNVCYYALTACNFYEDLLQISVELSEKETKEGKEKENFFYIETHYYINKCIAELNKMGNVIENVFTDNTDEVIYNSKIHFSRLKNIVDLLYEIREKLYSMKTVKSFLDTKAISIKYDDVMQDMIKRTNELKIYTNQLVWVSSNDKEIGDK